MIQVSLGLGMRRRQRRALSGQPVFRQPPALQGDGRIGEIVTLDPGVWEGAEAGSFTVEWMLNGVAIAGAAGLTFMPRSEDDRTRLRARVTVGNARGTTSATTENLGIVYPAPVVAGAIPELIYQLDSGVHTLDLSSFFSGSSLTFAVSGEGVSIDPDTGEVSIDSATLREGTTVVVTARNSGGAAEQSFKLTIAAEPVDPEAVVPVVLTPPALEGSGLIGAPLKIDFGEWGGDPAPELSLQWLRDGGAIEGATGLEYVPDAEDDGREITCRVTAVNEAGVLAAEPTPVTAVWPVPVAVDLLDDVTLEQGAAAATVDASAAFAGGGLSFAVSGAGAEIDPGKGVLTIPADVLLEAEAITVTASNSGGTAETSFAVTVVLPAPAAFPPLLADALWSTVEVRDAEPTGRRRVNISADVVIPQGFELAWYSGRESGLANPDWRRIMQPGEVYTTNNGLALGVACHNALFWRRVADGAWAPAAEVVVFDIAGPEIQIPLPVAPVLASAPMLVGSAEIGSAVTVEPGTWTGEPAPDLARQWLCDGQEIEGATGAEYVPVPEDDQTELACRVTARNAAGEASVTTDALPVTYPAPAVAGELFDEVFDQGTGPQTLETAQVFSGENLTFAVSGASAVIDPETGVLTIPTEASLSGETVTVRAANSGGAAESRFLVTVEEPGQEAFPYLLTDEDWTVAEVQDGNPVGRRRVEISKDVIVPEGFELGWYSGSESGLSNTDWRRIMQSGEVYTTSGGLAAGESVHNALFWRRVADNAWAAASDVKVFVIQGAASDSTPVVTNPVAVSERKSVSQYGFTFTFSTPRPAGQYANGDWFVQSPVSIISIAPASSGDRNGAMLDWGKGFADVGGGSGRGRAQGVDNRITRNEPNTIPYNSALNVDPGHTGSPLVFQNGQEGSVLKWKSIANVGDGRSATSDMAILTVVKDIPAARSFRPAPNARLKASYWLAPQLDLSVLPDLKPVIGMPPAASIIRFVERAHQHGNLDGTKQNINPSNNAPIAGREYATAMADVGLLLCTNVLSANEKRWVAELMVQNGVDIYERARLDGGKWADDGQLNCGRKLPLVIAAVLLNDSGMKSYANGSNTSLYKVGYKGCQSPRLGVPTCAGPLFHEDGQHFYVSQALINRKPGTGVGWRGGSVSEYPQSMLGKPEFGIEAWTWPNKNDSKMGAAYRPQNIQYAPGTVLTAHLIPGARATWNWPAYFDYVDYRVNWWMVQTSGGGQVPQWHKDMWKAYRRLGGPVYPAA